MTDIPEGQAFIAGRDGRVARKLLAAAANQKLDSHVVRTTGGGYLVPVSVADEYEGQSTAPAEPTPDEKSSTPDEDWKNADIEAYAADNDIDLGGATKKADMLAAIAAQEEKE